MYSNLSYYYQTIRIDIAIWQYCDNHTWIRTVLVSAVLESQSVSILQYFTSVRLIFLKLTFSTGERTLFQSSTDGAVPNSFQIKNYHIVESKIYLEEKYRKDRICLNLFAEFGQLSRGSRSLLVSTYFFVWQSLRFILSIRYWRALQDRRNDIDDRQFRR